MYFLAIQLLQFSKKHAKKISSFQWQVVNNDLAYMWMSSIPYARTPAYIFYADYAQHLAKLV